MGALTALSTGLGLYWGLLPFFERDPPMGGDFNIAVSPFRLLGEGGRPEESDEGKALADSFSDQLRRELEPFGAAGFHVEVRPPGRVGAVDGSDGPARAASAGRLAQRIKADLVVYGVLESAQSQSSFIPEFYVSERLFTGAEELVGQHELGGEVRQDGNVLNNPVARKLLRDRLLSRTRAMAQFVIGLGFYVLGNHYAEAVQRFELATQSPGWDEGPGKEVLYLFLGNAAAKVGDLAKADAAYSRSVAINSEYGRGRLGVAEIVFQKAKGTCEAGEVDGEGLERAASAFRQALAAKVQPAVSDVPVKTALGLGRVYVCQSQALLADRWADAERAFRQVVEAYEGGNRRVRQLAAEAYAGIGLVELPTADDPDAPSRFRQAASSYRRAVELSRENDRTAAFWATLGSINGRLGDRSSADAAYGEAIRLEPDPARRANYEKERADLHRSA